MQLSYRRVPLFALDDSYHIEPKMVGFHVHVDVVLRADALHGVIGGCFEPDATEKLGGFLLIFRQVVAIPSESFRQ